MNEMTVFNIASDSANPQSGPKSVRSLPIPRQAFITYTQAEARVCFFQIVLGADQRLSEGGVARLVIQGL
jgi:hypothetical protein